MIKIFNPINAIPLLLRSRFEEIFTWSWMVAFSLLIVGRGFPPLRPAIMIILSMVFVTGSVYFYNDIIDMEMDAFNVFKRNRPIPSKRVSREDAMKISYLFGIVGLTIAYLVNISSFVLVSTYLILFFIYSYPPIRLKTKLFGKDMTIFLGWPLCGQIASYAIFNTFSPQALYASLLVGIYIFAGGPVINESTDLQEDKDSGVKSLSTFLNWERKVQLMIFGNLIVMILSSYSFIKNGVSSIIPVLSIGMGLAFLLLIFPITKSYNQDNILKARRIGGVYLMSLQILIIVSSVQTPFNF